MPKIKCELEVSPEQLDEIRSTIEKFAPKAEAQSRADNSASLPCNFRLCSDCDMEQCSSRGAVQGCVPNCTAGG